MPVVRERAGAPREEAELSYEPYSTTILRRKIIEAARKSTAADFEAQRARAELSNWVVRLNAKLEEKPE